jgi:hypothetical protein
MLLFQLHVVFPVLSAVVVPVRHLTIVILLIQQLLNRKCTRCCLALRDPV